MRTLIYLLVLVLLAKFGKSIKDRDKLPSQKSLASILVRKNSNEPKVDFCEDDDENLINENHIVGICRSFNTHRCLCELNPNCEYNEESEECQNLDDCNLYQGNPSGCRAAHCNFDCGTKRCVAKSEIPEECTGMCSKFCYDICACQSHNCQYSSQGACQEAKKIIDCPAIVFISPYCARIEGRYIHNGVFCRNPQQRGNCVLEKTVVAVNFGGGAATDSHGVIHVAETELPPRDVNQIKLTHTVDNNNEVTGRDAAFYKNIIYANVSKKTLGGCVEYTIPICEDGVYELVVKTIEVFDVLPGEKQFNIKLGDQYVFPEVDVMKIIGKRFQPLELIANFKVKQKLLTVDGVLEYTIKDGMVPLGFCYSECATTSISYFEVAAFSVSKFQTNSNTNTAECASFNDDPWSCRAANCHYNYNSQKCIPPDSGCSPTMPEIPKCLGLGLDIVFLLDSTSSHEGNRGSGLESLVFDEFSRIVGITSGIKAKYPQAKFGIGLFSEFSCNDFPKSLRLCNDVYPNGVRNHADANGCYRHHLALTDNLQVVNLRARREELSILYSNAREPGFFASMMAVQDRAMNWTKNGFPATKIIILVTDDSVHVGNTAANADNVKVPAKFDGTDTCWGTQPLSSDKLNNYFAREGVSFYFLVGRQAHADSYQNVLDSNLVPSASEFITAPTDSIQTGVENFIEQQFSKVKETGGCVQEKPQCPPIRLELLFLLDSSSDWNNNNNGQLSSRSTVFDVFSSRVVDITDGLRQKFPLSKFGIALFSEFSCYDWKLECKPDAKGYAEHADGNGCYTHHQRLTNDLELFKQRAQRDLFKIYPSIYSEPGLFGALLAVQNCNSNWTWGNPNEVNKIIVLMTNDEVHLSSPNKRKNKIQAKFDGTDSCSKTLQPTADNYNLYFQQQGISFFLLGNTDGTIRSYQSVFQSSRVATQSEYMDSTNEKIEKKLTDFITNLNINKEKKMLEQGSCSPSCDGPPVDVVYLLDSTSSYSDTGPSVSLVLDEFSKIVGSATILQKKYPLSRFGIALFSDFACSDAGTDSCNQNFPEGTRRHDDCFGCYRRHQRLTSNLTLLNQQAQRNQLSIKFSEANEPGLFDAVLAVQDCHMNWWRGSTRSIKVIVIITDAELHTDSPNAKTNKVPAKLDGTDTCCGSLQPTQEQFNEFFAREGISIMLVVNQPKIAGSYLQKLDTRRVPTEVDFIDSTTTKIGQALEKLVRKQIKDKPKNC